MALRPRGTQTRHPQVDDIRFDFAEIFIGQSDPLNHVNAVIIEHGVGFSDQIVQHPWPLWMLEIHRE